MIEDYSKQLFAFSHRSEVRWWGWRWPAGRCSPPLRRTWCWRRRWMRRGWERVFSASLRPGAQHKPDLSLHDFMHTSNPQTCFLASSLCKWCSGLIQRDAKKKACYFLSVCAHTHVRNLHHVTGYLVFISPRSCSRVPLQTVSCKWASDECMGNLYLYDRMCQR